MFLSPKIVLNGYYKGIFPMADSIDDPYIYWVDPKERGIIFLDNFRFSASLKKFVKKKPYTVKVNKNFHEVIKFCSNNSRRETSWINKQIIENYIHLHEIGKAKSIECYFENNLVGGLYGIIMGKFFCGESMFSLKKNSSKVALVHLAAYLKQGGFKFIDTHGQSAGSNLVYKLQGTTYSGSATAYINRRHYDSGLRGQSRITLTEIAP